VTAMTKSKAFTLLLTFFGFLALAPAASAAVPEYVLVIKDQKFEPPVLKVPANTKVKLIIKNEDATAEEFESYDLNREKVVAPHGEIKIYVGPLKPGSYKFFGEFNAETAKGQLVAE